MLESTMSPVDKGNPTVLFLMTIDGNVRQETVNYYLQDGQNVFDQPPFSWGLTELGETALRQENDQFVNNSHGWGILREAMSQQCVPAMKLVHLCSRWSGELGQSNPGSQKKLKNKYGNDARTIVNEMIGGGIAGKVSTDEALQILSPLVQVLHPFVDGTTRYLDDVRNSQGYDGKGNHKPRYIPADTYSYTHYLKTTENSNSSSISNPLFGIDEVFPLAGIKDELGGVDTRDLSSGKKQPNREHRLRGSGALD